MTHISSDDLRERVLGEIWPYLSWDFRLTVAKPEYYLPDWTETMAPIMESFAVVRPEYGAANFNCNEFSRCLQSMTAMQAWDGAGALRPPVALAYVAGQVQINGESSGHAMNILIGPDGITLIEPQIVMPDGSAGLYPLSDGLLDDIFRIDFL